MSKSRATAQQLGIALSETFEKCENCAISKIKKKKNIPKASINKAKVKGERVYMDISSIQYPSYGGSKYWTLLVDEATNKCWSLFLKAKSGLLKDQVIPWIRTIQKTHGVHIKVLRCDNAGENNSLEASIQATTDLTTRFEYTAHDAPEQNGVLERKFQSLYAKVRPALNGARLPKDLRNGHWAHCAETMTKLENLGRLRG